MYELLVLCPIPSLSPPKNRPRFEETIVEQRSRRDSEKCIVQLTGAVTLLAEPSCIKHPRRGGKPSEIAREYVGYPLVNKHSY